MKLLYKRKGAWKINNSKILKLLIVIHFYTWSEIHFTMEHEFFHKKVTKRETWSQDLLLNKETFKSGLAKHIVLFSKRIGGVVVFVGKRAKKTLFTNEFFFTSWWQPGLDLG